MKKHLLLVAFTLSFVSLQSQIIHKDYGPDGKRVALNQNEEFDIDEDGKVDLYINKHANELGFSPIFGFGCLSSPFELAYTNFNAREMTIFQEGDVIKLNGSNLYDYIDDDRGSMYNINEDFADGWENETPNIIGFAIINDNVIKDGWMRVAANQNTNELIIYELAYTSDGDYTTEGIKAGDRGLTQVKDLGEELAGFNVGPNPASNFINVSFNYSGKESLSINVLDVTGKVVYNHNRTIQIGSNNFDIETSNWNAGTYLLQLRNETGVQVQKLSIIK